jgi:hypothetical protein
MNEIDPRKAEHFPYFELLDFLPLFCSAPFRHHLVFSLLKKKFKEEYK